MVAAMIKRDWEGEEREGRGTGVSGGLAEEGQYPIRDAAKSSNGGGTKLTKSL